jgi:hypothetical protein
MKFRVAFSVSKSERKLSIRFWKWDIWRLSSIDDWASEDIAGKNPSKAGFFSLKKIKEGEDPELKSDSGDFNKLLLQAMFYPNVESRIWRVCKKIIAWIYNLFSVKFENLEIKGSIGDPFCDAIALGMSGGNYFPTWENENGNWEAKGEVILKISILYLLFFILATIYEALILAIILWLGTRLAKRNPGGENLSEIRRWLFLKAGEAA